MKKTLISVILLVLVLGLNIYFRAFPINFPQLKTQAKMIVAQKNRQEAIKKIDQRFSEFDPLIKGTLVEGFASDYKKQNRKAINKRIWQEYIRLKDRYQDASGQTYLMELDCWHWARYVDNVCRLGHPGDKIINGRQWDALMLAPLGSYLSWNSFLYYLSSFLYKLFCLIKPVPIFTFVFYLPLLFSAVFIITLYLFCYYRFGNLAAVISCLFVGLAPIFLNRSSAGWFDTDILNLFFPLLALWAYLTAYKVSSFRLRIFWVCFSGFWIGLFSFTWANWWFIFLIIIAYEIYSLLNLSLEYLLHKEKNLSLCRQHILSSILFLIFSLLWVVIFSGFGPLLSLYLQVKEAVVLNNPLWGSVWPNVYSTVGELKKANFSQIANLTGGQFLFIFSLLCMLCLFLFNRKYSDFEREHIFVLTFWFIAMLFACFRGVRFVMFLIIPLGISLGWMVQKTYEYFRDKKEKSMAFLVIVIVIALSAIFINNGYSSAKGIFPLMNDHWYGLLVSLKESTPKDAVVNSWWDFGDWFKAVAKRPVIFDGQSQNTPLAYWMARVLITNDEKEAMGTLRMLNNGSNKAFEMINEYLKDPFRSAFLLKKAVFSGQKEAQDSLSKFLPSSLVQELMKLLFAKPNKAYFVVDYTMPAKINPISYLGNWDFLKVYLSQNSNKKEKSQILDYLRDLGMDDKRIERLLSEAGLISPAKLDDWVSHKLSFYGGLARGEEKEGVVLFDNGLIYNLKNQTVQIYSSRDNGYKIPKSLFTVENNILKEKAFSGSDLNYSVLIFKINEGWRVISLDRELANSLFVRLYFLNGATLKSFKPFIEKKDGDNFIRVFEVIWE